MKRIKFNLRSLKVKSFITTFDSQTYKTIKGGTGLQDDDTTSAFSDHCGLSDDCELFSNPCTETVGETVQCRQNISFKPCTIG